jgi:hypothetical protein
MDKSVDRKIAMNKHLDDVVGANKHFRVRGFTQEDIYIPDDILKTWSNRYLYAYICVYFYVYVCIHIFIYIYVYIYMNMYI